LFSDCGTATALEYDENADLMRFDLNSDGSGFKAIYIRSGGGRHPFSADDLTPKMGEDGVVRKGTDVVLDGVGILNFTIREIPGAVMRFFERTRTTAADYDALVFHQANLLINETIRKRLKVEKEKMPMTLYNFGNTSSASVPITIQQHFQDGLNSSRRRLLLCGFGVGLSWASADVVFDHTVCLPLIEI
jgi:3-oxoacyl-[acyl-carrier-protein] synthase-3